MGPDQPAYTVWTLSESLRPLWVILCRLPEKGRKETEEIADDREGQGRKRDRSESEETEEIKTSPPYPYLQQGQQALPICKPISFGRPGDIRYMIPSHHPTTP